MKKLEDLDSLGFSETILYLLLYILREIINQLAYNKSSGLDSMSSILKSSFNQGTVNKEL